MRTGRARFTTAPPPDWLRPSFECGQYLAFLGRLAPEKGPESAIRIARAANMQLRIAAKIPRGRAGGRRRSVCGRKSRTRRRGRSTRSWADCWRRPRHRLHLSKFSVETRLARRVGLAVGASFYDHFGSLSSVVRDGVWGSADTNAEARTNYARLTGRDGKLHGISLDRNRSSHLLLLVPNPRNYKALVKAREPGGTQTGPAK
jgi:hypothetical protein